MALISGTIINTGVVLGDKKIAWEKAPTEIGSLSRCDMLDTFEINGVNTLKITEAFVPHILKSKRKQIATISSLSGSVGENKEGGTLAYQMSKAALNMGMQEFAIKLKDQGIHVLLFHPGSCYYFD